MRTDVFDIAEPAYRPGRQVEAFNVVMDQDDARERLLRLKTKGRLPGRLYALCGLLMVDQKQGVGFARSLSLRSDAVEVRDGDFTFETPIARAIVLIFADRLPERLREQRAAVYSYFKETG